MGAVAFATPARVAKVATVASGLSQVCPVPEAPAAGQVIECTYVAAHPVTTTTEPTTTTTTTTTTTPPVVTTTTTTPPAGRSCPALPAFPTAACTGVPPGTALTTVSGDVTAPAGTVIDGKKITGRVNVTGNGVVIRNSEVYGGVSNGSGHWTFSVVDTTLGAPDGNGCNGDPAVMFDKYTVTRVLIRNFSDLFRATSNPQANHSFSNSAASDITVQDSFSVLCSNAGDHADGFQGYYGGTNVKILHNTLDMSGPTQNAPSTVTAPIFNSDYSKGITLKDNLLSGGSYTIRLDDDGLTQDASKSTVSGNRVVNKSAGYPGAWVYGPVHSDCGSINPNWTDNTLVTIDGSYSVTSTVGPLACS